MAITDDSPGTSAYPAPQVQNQGRPWSIAGLVCAVVAVILVPFVLGPMGATFGFIGRSKGDRTFGLWVGIAGIVATVVGVALSIAVFNAATN